MKTQIKKENGSPATVKQTLGVILSALTVWLGYGEAPDLVISFGAFIGSVYVLTNFVKNLVSHPFLNQVFSWVLGIVIAMVAYWLNMGIFDDMTLAFALVTGFFGSLAANGIYDSGWLETLWNILKTVFNVKKT